jgi:hypothetical protein
MCNRVSLVTLDSSPLHSNTVLVSHLDFLMHLLDLFVKCCIHVSQQLIPRLIPLLQVLSPSSIVVSPSASVVDVVAVCRNKLLTAS